MAWDDDLKGRALEIAKVAHTPLRVMAGPGTGKSFALKRRIARLLEEGADPKRILAVTFTRTAAASVVDDLKNLGSAGSEDIWAGTLHAYCFGLLSKQDVFDFLNRKPRPVTAFYKSGSMQFEGAPLLTDICTNKDFGKKRESTKRIHAFEAAWARLQVEDPGWAKNPVDKAFQKELMTWLIFHKAILIGELIWLALDYLRNNPAAPERNAFDHVLVDEYQDLNKAEQVLIDLLCKNSNQCLVGDVDQSIYSFRYAHPEGITTFSDTHPGTHDVELDECRRCPSLIVSLANNLILHNYPTDITKRLTPLAGNPVGEAHIVQWNKLEDESQGLAGFCQHLIVNKGYQPNDILILTSRKIFGYSIRNALVDLSVPVHSFFNEECLELEETRESFCLLTLHCDRDDRVALRYWLGLGSPSWNAGAYKKLRNYCEEENRSPWETLQGLKDGSIKISGTKNLVDRFDTLILRIDD